jgi:hypothetical protein
MSTHFILPGRRTNPKLSATKFSVAKAYALSRSCNPRNVESYSYGLWCQCWTDLTGDAKNLTVNPQYLLYYVLDETSDEEDKGDGRGDEEEDDALANTTIETIESRTSTKAERTAEEIVPDFAIVRVMFRLRNEELRATWENVKIRHAGVPLLAEVKRAGRRSLTKVLFLKSTMIYMKLAQDDLFRQAAYLFTMHPRQQYVVLAACSGIYWSCRIVNRQTVMDRVVPMPADEFAPEADEDNDETESDEGLSDDDEGAEELFEDNPDAFDLVNEPDGFEEAQDQGSPSQSEEDEETEDMYLEPIVAEENLAIPENTWTKLLRLDSRASNQNFFWIHSHLQTVTLDPTGAMG